MKYDRVIIPTIKIHPSKIITYNQILYTNAKPTRTKSYSSQSTLVSVEVNGKIELKRVSTKFLNSSRSANGELSKQAKKKLSLAIEYFLTINKPDNSKSGNTGRHYQNKIAFITLTLPSKQVHSDNDIKSKCLNQFLIELSKYHKVSNYVWRAEYQKNGNIHFHILVNRYIFWNDIRNRWNRIINKLGYVDRYRDYLKEYHATGFQVRTDLLKTWPLENQIKAYQEGLKTDFHNPNSIDVHSINNITNIKNYITKYMSKSVVNKDDNLEEHLENHRASGRIWGASIIFSNLRGATTEIDNQIEEHLKKFEEMFPDKVFKSDYFTILDIDIHLIAQLRCTRLLSIFHRYLFQTFGISSQESF